MKCYYHNERDGVGQCNHCGKVLCKECVDVYNPPLCTDCAGIRNNERKMNTTTEIVLSIAALIFGGFMYFLVSDSFELVKFLMYLIGWGGVPYGWNALNKITPSIFLILPLIGWVIYFVIKLMIALYIGWIIFIIRVIKIIRDSSNNKSMSDYIKRQNG